MWVGLLEVRSSYCSHSLKSPGSVNRGYVQNRWEVFLFCFTKDFELESKDECLMFVACLLSVLRLALYVFITIINYFVYIHFVV